MPIIAQLALSSGASGFIDLKINEVGRMNVVVETISTADVSSISVYDGIGGQAEPNLAVGPVKWTAGTNQHGTSYVMWDMKGTSYNLSSRISDRQTVSLGLNIDLCSNWVSIGIPTVSANTQINVYGFVT